MDDTYWTEEIGLFEGAFRSAHGEPRIVRARVYMSKEAYPLDARDQEIVPITTPVGTRTYVHLQPSPVVPDIQITVASPPAPGQMA